MVQLSQGTLKSSCSVPAALNSYSPTGWSCRSHVKLRLARPALLRGGALNQMSQSPGLLLGNPESPGDICQTSPLPFCIPTIPHLNTKNFLCFPWDYNHPGLLLLGVEVPNRAVRIGLLNLGALINSTSCWPIVRNVWSVARRHSPVQLGELPKQLLCLADHRVH